MIYLFDNQERLIKIVNSTAIQSIEQSQELTKDGYVSDKLIANVKVFDDDTLNKIEYMAIKSVDEKYGYDLYFLLSHSITGNLIELVGVQSGIEELRKSLIYNKRPTSSVRQHAEMIVEETNWTIGYVPETSEQLISYFYINAFEALKKLASSFGIEFQFHVEINGNRIGNRYIEFKKHIGQVTHRRVTYGHNALQVVKVTQKEGIYTALVGRGKGIQVSEAGEANEDGTIQESAGYSRKIEFDELVWSKDKGDPVDKPAGQKFVEIPSATELYGIKTPSGMAPKVGVVEIDTEDKSVLLQRTYDQLLEMCRPKALFKTSAVYLTAGIGDTVRVVRNDIKIDYPVRVIKIVWDRLTDRAISIELGDRIANSITDRIQSITDESTGRLTDEINRMVGERLDHIPSADGFNTNWYGDKQPENPRINDIWYQPDPEFEGEFIIRMWTGEIWKKLMSKDFSKELEAKFAEQAKKTKEMEQSIIDAEARANQAIADAGLQTLTEANRVAEQKALDRYNQAVAEAKRLDGLVETNVKKLIDGIQIDSSQLTDSGEYKASIIQATVDSINQTITAVSRGKVTGLNQLTNTVYGMEQIVSSPDSLARQLMTSQVFQSEVRKYVPVPTDEQIKQLAETVQLSKADIEAMFVDGFLSDADLQKIAEQAGLSVEEVKQIIGDKIAAEMVQQYEAQVIEAQYLVNDGSRPGGPPTFRGVYTLSRDLKPTDTYNINVYMEKPITGQYVSLKVVSDNAIVAIKQINSIKVGNNHIASLSFVPPRLLKAGDKLRLEIVGMDGSVREVKIWRKVTIQVPTETGSGVIASKITQLNDSIDLALFGRDGAISKINAGAGGLYLKGENIRLDGKVSMDEAYIKKLFVDEMTAETIKAHTAVFANAIIDSLEANVITAKKATFIESLWKSAYSHTYVDGTHIGIKSNNGTNAIELNQYGMDVFDTSGIEKGNMQWFDTRNTNLSQFSGGAVGIGVSGNTLLALGHRATDGIYEMSIGIDSNNGNITISNMISYLKDLEGLKYTHKTINGIKYYGFTKATKNYGSVTPINKGTGVFAGDDDVIFTTDKYFYTLKSILGKINELCAKNGISGYSI